jgi:hypothetical protein
MRVRGEFCQVSIFAKLVCQTIGGYFFLILPKLDEYQVDLSNCWSCQILLDKFCVLATSRKICQVKKEFIFNNLARREVSFAKFLFLPSWFFQTVGDQIFLFCQN